MQFVLLVIMKNAFSFAFSRLVILVKLSSNYCWIQSVGCGIFSLNDPISNDASKKHYPFGW